MKYFIASALLAAAVLIGASQAAAADAPDICDGLAYCYAPTACSDGIDNDGDGRIDLADPGCADSGDLDETDAASAPPPPDDWGQNVGWYTDYNDDGYSFLRLGGGCRAPVARREYRGSFGTHHWTYFEKVTFCWRNGVITSFSRERWIWMSGSLLNGWSFKGHINSNCDGDCSGMGFVGRTTASAWTQGLFEFCSLRWALCTEQTPLLGIRVYGDGRITYFRDNPQ
jgi:hypothetical protein